MRRLLTIALMAIVVISGATAVAEDGEEIDVYEFDETYLDPERELIYPPECHYYEIENFDDDGVNLLRLDDPVQPGSSYRDRKSADPGVLRVRH